MIKIVSLRICPFVQRVTATLEAKNIPYEIDYISLQDKPDWFLEISPTGQVPLLLTENGVSLFESDAIVEYIDEISAPLENDITAEQRAINRAWSYQASKHYLVQCSTMRSSDATTFAERSSNLQKSFAKVERVLEEGPYFNGSQLGNVDLAWLPLLHRASIVEQHGGFDFLAKFPKVKKWQNRLLETGIAQKSVAEDFDGIFKDFYLSDATYLGRGYDPEGLTIPNDKPNKNSCCD